MIWLFVLVRIVANPFSNVFQKLLTREGASSLAIVCVTHGLLSVACLPIFLFYLPPLPWEFWSNILICAALTVSGNVLIVQAVKHSDLSVLGPINAYKAIVSLLPGMIWLGEYPGWLGVAGMALIVLGSYFIVDKQLNQPKRNAFVRFFRERGIQYRFAALVLSAIEAVFFKRALQATTPLATFAFWCLLGFVLSLVIVLAFVGAAQRSQDVQVIRSQKNTCLWLMLTTGLMQLCTSYSLAGLQVGYALALFQTSTLISVILGRTVFREQHFWERLVGSLVMMAGAALVIVGR